MGRRDEQDVNLLQLRRELGLCIDVDLLHCDKGMQSQKMYRIPVGSSGVYICGAIEGWYCKQKVYSSTCAMSLLT
jgi:hypothetical protein